LGKGVGKKNLTPPRASRNGRSHDLKKKGDTAPALQSEIDRYWTRAKNFFIRNHRGRFHNEGDKTSPRVDAKKINPRGVPVKRRVMGGGGFPGAEEKNPDAIGLRQNGGLEGDWEGHLAREKIQEKKRDREESTSSFKNPAGKDGQPEDKSLWTMPTPNKAKKNEVRDSKRTQGKNRGS